MGFLDGQAAIVTGAAVGLGSNYARALAKAGANLTICDVRPEVAQTGQEIAGQFGVKVDAHVADVSVAADVKRVVDGAMAAYGRIDVLISNAGIWRGSTATDAAAEPDAAHRLDKTLEDYEKLIGTNLRGVYLFGRAVIPHMIAGGGGNIINIATDHVHTHPGRPTLGGGTMDLYDASKWGVSGFTVAWAKALKEHHIRVNAMCPGATDSFMLRGFNGPNVAPEVVATWMKPDEVCDLAIQLIREGPSGRTGQQIGTWVGHEIVLQPIPPAKADHIIS